jgi:predicted MFS family arabinose efflux permease
MLIATGLAVMLQSVAHPPEARGQRVSFGRSIIDGWRFSWAHETLRAGLLCVMLVSLFIVPFTTLLPVFARDLLGVGASGQGLMLTAMGVGAFFSAALIASAGDQLPRGALMLGSAVVYGLMIVAFAGSTWFPLSLGVMMLAGLAHVHSNALVQTVIQSYSPTELRGRTLAIFSMHQVLVTAGAVLFGGLASLLGPRWAVATMGVFGALSMIGILIAMPRARFIR